MSLIISNVNLKKQQREKLQADINLYLKLGGKIFHVPFGWSAIADGRVPNGDIQYIEEQMDKHKFRGPGIRIGKK